MKTKACSEILSFLVSIRFGDTTYKTFYFYACAITDILAPYMACTLTFPSRAELVEKVPTFRIMQTTGFYLLYYRKYARHYGGIPRETIARVESVVDAIIRQLANSIIPRQECHQIIDNVLAHQDAPLCIRGKLIEYFEGAATISTTEIIELQTSNGN